MLPQLLVTSASGRSARRQPRIAASRRGSEPDIGGGATRVTGTSGASRPAQSHRPSSDTTACRHRAPKWLTTAQNRAPRVAVAAADPVVADDPWVRAMRKAEERGLA